MNVDEWLKVLTAVIVGNALTVWWAYSLWRVTQNEHKGIAPHRGPLIYLIGLAVPPLAALVGALLLRATV